MNLDRSNPQANEQSSVLATQAQTDGNRVPRIERCEFETLLERAMEILSVRAKTPSSSQA